MRSKQEALRHLIRSLHNAEGNNTRWALIMAISEIASLILKDVWDRGIYLPESIA